MDTQPAEHDLDMVGEVFCPLRKPISRYGHVISLLFLFFLAEIALHEFLEMLGTDVYLAVSKIRARKERCELSKFTMIVASLTFLLADFSAIRRCACARG